MGGVATPLPSPAMDKEWLMSPMLATPLEWRERVESVHIMGRISSC